MIMFPNKKAPFVRHSRSEEISIENRPGELATLPRDRLFRVVVCRNKCPPASQRAASSTICALCACLNRSSQHTSKVTYKISRACTGSDVSRSCYRLRRVTCTLILFIFVVLFCRAGVEIFYDLLISIYRTKNIIFCHKKRNNCSILVNLFLKYDLYESDSILESS